MKKIIICSAIIAFIFSCTKQNGDELALGTRIKELCSKDTISYKNDIKYIIDSDCIGCHSTAQALGGVILDNYTDLSMWASADLLNVVRQESGFPAMPRGSTKIHECKIRALETWVAQGMLNN